MSQVNFADLIVEAANGEPIESVVIGPGYFYDNAPSAAPTGVMMTWAEAVKWLDYEFYSGFGGAGCHPVFVWTKNWVHFVHEYDGSTSISSVPRNPCDCIPEYS